MKWILSIAILIVISTLPSFAFAKEGNWKEIPSKTDIELDKEWILHFNEEVDVDSLRGNISIIRESDNQPMSFIDPYTLDENKKSIKLYLGTLFEFNETYKIEVKNIKSVDGNSLKKPVKMTFSTISSSFPVHKTMEIDGVRIDLYVSTKNLLQDDKVYTKVKVTNVSGKVISYWGADGCDKGVKATISAVNEDGKEVKADKWYSSVLACTAALEQYSLQPQETIEILEVLYPPKGMLTDAKVNVLFNIGNLNNEFSLETIQYPFIID